MATAVLAVAGCSKPPIPGYGPEPLPAAVPPPPVAAIDPAALPEGWGYVDVLCEKGVNDGRGVPDTLFGCLLRARDSGKGVVKLPEGVYLGHAAGFIVKALKYYHVESRFEQLYGHRVVLVFRPASEEEIKERDGNGAGRIGLGIAGEAVLTVAAGAPLIPIIAPMSFAFESVSEDIAFQRFKRDAAAKGIAEPTRRGDEIVAEEYSERYEGYWDAVTGRGKDDSEAPPRLYIVERCSIQREGEAPVELVARDR